MSTSTELQEKVEKAARVVESIPGFDLSGGYDQNWAEAYIWNKLKQMQIGKDEVSHEMLISDYTKEGDMRAVFCEGSEKLAVPWFRKIFAILKGDAFKADAKDVVQETFQNGTLGQQSDVAEAIAKLIESNRPVSQWKDGELVAALNADCSSEIVSELKKRANDWAVVAFDDEEKEKVNVEVTVKMLQLSRRRELPQVARFDGKTYRLFEVGKWPNAVFAECPMHEGVLLTEDYCDECEVDYSGVSKESLVFLRILAERGEVDATDKLRLRDLIKTAKEKGLLELCILFPKAAFEYEDRKGDDSLPSLKSRLAAGRNRSQDPLNPGKRVY